MIEVIVLGRGGQGAVTAAQLIAIAAGYDGKQSQAFPMFGVERRGAPVQAFARISDKTINIRSHVYKADFFIVLDPSLLRDFDADEILKDKAVVVINSKEAKEIKGHKVFCVDATGIALKIFGRDITNTMMVAAFAEFTGVLKEKSILRAVGDVFEGDLAKKNQCAIDEMYNVVRK